MKISSLPPAALAHRPTAIETTTPAPAEKGAAKGGRPADAAAMPSPKPTSLLAPETQAEIVEAASDTAETATPSHGKSAQSPAHRARALLAGAYSDLAGLPFGKLVSALAKGGSLDALRTTSEPAPAEGSEPAPTEGDVADTTAPTEPGESADVPATDSSSEGTTDPAASDTIAAETPPAVDPMPVEDPLAELLDEMDEGGNGEPVLPA
jgi:hypothetical protein